MLSLAVERITEIGQLSGLRKELPLSTIPYHSDRSSQSPCSLRYAPLEYAMRRKLAPLRSARISMRSVVLLYCGGFELVFQSGGGFLLLLGLVGGRALK